MTTYLVQGSTKLSGEVNLQGAKNSALKHLLIPLLTNDKFVFSNIPDISSSTNPAKIVELQGGEVHWKNPNTVQMDTSGIDQSAPVSHELFFHTSGGILLIPILVTKYGRFEIEKAEDDKETGGDQIGRSLDVVNNTLKQLGISSRKTDKSTIYELSSDKPLDYEIPNRSFGVSVMGLLTSLLRNGSSIFKKPTRNSEFKDVVNLLQKMGGDIVYTDESLTVNGGKKLIGVKYSNMFDKHDFVTFLSAAVCTESEILINNVEYDKMKLDCLEDFLDQSNINLEYDKKNNKCLVHKNAISDLKPVNVVASDYPNFVTEWQVLLSPLFALIKGNSKIVEGIFPNRMRHWEQLGKMGAKYTYIKHPDYKEDNNNPRAVLVDGGASFKGARAESKDVRCGAALIIAALATRGESEIVDRHDHIKRGYENLDGRLNSLGAMIAVK